MNRASVFFVFTILLICIGGCSSEGDRINDPANGQLGDKEFRLQRPDQRSLQEMDEPLDDSPQLDIKPGSFPNPLNPNSHGKLPAALMGSSTFDIGNIDVSSLLLEGVAPLKTRVEDVDTDGYDDLALKFMTGDIFDALKALVPGDVITLKLTGEMADGNQFFAEDDIVIVGKPATLGLELPETPDALMANFQAAYENMSYDGLRELLHPDFLMVLQESTIQEFPDLGTTLDLNEELRIHDRMFSGQSVEDPEGNFVPGVQEIVFSMFRRLDTWQPTPSDDIFPNVEWAPYEVEILFDRGPGFSTLKVEGMIKFYVKSRELVYKGETHRYYQMIGQVDLTNGGAKTEGFSWGSTKALYR
jgi:hypothetical protein